MTYELRPYQQQAADIAVKFLLDRKKDENGLIVLPTGCHEKGTEILMYDGSRKKVEEIDVGDEVMGDDGTPRRVLKLHHGEDEMYRIIPMAGEPIVVNGGHLLALYRTTDRNVIPDIISVRDYFEESAYYKQSHQLLKLTEYPLTTDFRVEQYGYGEYFGFTLDGNHLYCDGQFFVHHNSGKSLVIADIANRVKQYGPLLILQPSKEILEQNFLKLQSYGCWDSAIYSASMSSKDINMVTFATIGSIMNHLPDFSVFKMVIIDEAHCVNSKAGQYKEFIEAEQRKVIGLTATPYRLGSYEGGLSVLKFLTRTRPRIFSKMLYCCQISELLANGYLADLRYFDCTSLDMKRVRANSTGADFDEKSLLLEYERSKFYDNLTSTVIRVLHPKSGVPRNGILVFTRFVKEADLLVKKLQSIGVRAAIVTGETKKVEREQLLQDFKNGEIKVIANVGVLTTGFDYPALDTVIMARPTKSLALWYQSVGRIIRPYKGKDAWVIDLGGSYRRFGAVSDLTIGLEKPNSSRWAVFSNGRQLTNTPFE